MFLSLRNRWRSAFCLIAALMIVSDAQADVTIDDFAITSNTVSISLSGFLPASFPDEQPAILYFVNPTVDADPGFALGDFLNADTVSFSGSQSLRSFTPLATGGPEFGDYFFVAFSSPLMPGEDISGIINGSWSSTAFDPSAVSSLNLQWGTGTGDVVGEGVQLSRIAVPEPSSSIAFLVLGLVAASFRRLQRA